MCGCAAALLVLLSLCSVLLVLVLRVSKLCSLLLCSAAFGDLVWEGGAAPTGRAGARAAFGVLLLLVISVLLVVLVLDVLLVFCFSAAPEVSCGWTVVQHRFFI